MEARTSKEETELMEEEKRKKSAMTKEVTKSMIMELKDLPNEILVKIFNFLPNHDIRCGVSLACKKFNRYSARKLRKNGITNLDFFIGYMVKGPTNMSSFTS